MPLPEDILNAAIESQRKDDEELKRQRDLKDAETPTGLPVGRAEFETWAKDIIRLAGAPDNFSIRGALATMIMQFPASTYRVPKRTMVDMLLKGMANEVASAVYREAKLQYEAAAKAEAEAAKAAETSSGQQQ